MTWDGVDPQHGYRPDPRTGQCLGCPPRGSGGCLWCSHDRSQHNGPDYLDPAVRKHYEVIVPGPGGKPVVSSTVKWSTTACGAGHCACRTYEVRGR